MIKIINQSVFVFVPKKIFFLICKSLQPTLHSHRHKAANTPLILICLKEERGEEFRPSFLYATNKITLLLLRHMQKYAKPLGFLTELSLFTTSPSWLRALSFHTAGHGLASCPTPICRREASRTSRGNSWGKGAP